MKIEPEQRPSRKPYDVYSGADESKRSVTFGTEPNMSSILEAIKEVFPNTPPEKLVIGATPDQELHLGVREE